MENNDDMKSMEDVLNEAIAYMARRHEVLPEKRSNYYETLASFREYYHHNEADILSLARKDRFKWLLSYPVDWVNFLTPIELHIWNIIRSTGRIVLYPQYPIGPFFADFANPYLKIALEVDGKEFHLDREKDLKRDLEMKRNGWEIFRVTGAETYRIIDVDWEDEYESGFDAWLSESADGVIWAIRQLFFEEIDLDHPRINEIISTLVRHSNTYTGP